MQLCNDVILYFICDEQMQLKCINMRYHQQKKFSLILQRFKICSTYHRFSHKSAQFAQIGSQLALRKTTIVLHDFQMAQSLPTAFWLFRPFSELRVQLPLSERPDIECIASYTDFQFPIYHLTFESLDIYAFIHLRDSTNPS